jgi:hypothetical protein
LDLDTCNIDFKNLAKYYKPENYILSSMIESEGFEKSKFDNLAAKIAIT